MPDTVNVNLTSAAPTSATVLKSITVRLKDIDVAPENPRFLEGPDEQIPDLASSLAPDAAGLLVPLLVRPGRKKEKPFMVLDGRRRLFAFRHLLAAGLIGDDIELAAYLCETEDAVAAAAITANQARLPLKPAEVILAIRALSAKKITVEAMARALCVDLAEARKFRAVSQVHMDVLMAFKDKLFDFSVLKLIARVLSQADQKKLAKAARDNGRLWAGHVQHYLDADGMSANSATISFVGLNAYLAAGGKTTSDLLGELPDVCINPELAYGLWAEKVQPLKDFAEAEGLAVFVTTDDDADLPEEFCSPPYRYHRLADEQAHMAALKADHDAIAERNEDALATGDISAWQDILRAKLAHAKASAAPMTIRAILIQPDEREAVSITSFTTEADVAAWQAEKAPDLTPSYTPEPSRNPDPLPERKVIVDTSDHGHAFHRCATDALVRGFRRCLSESFIAALKLQVASQFQQVVLIQTWGIGDDKALQISCAKNVQSRGYGAVDGLDQDLVDRLLVYREAYVASGLRPYAWVSTLGFAHVQDLLALLTAANVWIEEDRTDRIKSRARGQIQDIAEELDFDLRTYWYPDGPFYAKGSKKQLLGYALQMGCDLDEIANLKKAALADFVAEQGVARQWMPPSLSFDNAIVEAEVEGPGDAEIDGKGGATGGDASPASQAIAAE